MVIRKVMLVNKQNGTFSVFGTTPSIVNFCHLKANYANWWFLLIIESTSYYENIPVWMFSNLLINMLFLGWFLKKSQQWFLYRRCILKIHNTKQFNWGLQSNTNPISFLKRGKTTLVEANFASVGQPPSSGSGPHLNYHGIIRFVWAISSSESFLARPCISLSVFTNQVFPPLNLVQVYHILTTSRIQAVKIISII